MLSEKEMQSFEELIQQLSERRRHHTSRQLNEVLQAYRELQAENARLREQMDHFLACVVTVKKKNTDDWMDYISEEINKCLESLGDTDRVAVKNCCLSIKKGVNHGG